MSTTLAQLRSQLQVELRDPNDKIWSSASKNQYINSAYFQIQKDNNFQWRWNIASQALSSPYTLPDAFVIMDAVTYSNNLIYLMDKIALRKMYKDLTTTGNPIYYYYDGAVITTYPVTTGSLTIDYRKRLTALSADADLLAFPDAFADAIIKYAKYLAWSSPRGNANAAQEAISDYGQAYTTLLGSYGLNDFNNLTFNLARGIPPYRDNAIY